MIKAKKNTQINFLGWLVGEKKGGRGRGVNIYGFNISFQYWTFDKADYYFNMSLSASHLSSTLLMLRNW